MKAEAANFGVPQINLDPSAGWDIAPKYVFRRLLGFGSYGSVCEAIYLPTKARVAIKKFLNIFQDSGGCKRVLREIELLHLINHPYIVKPLDVFIKQGSDLYLVMEMGQADLFSLRRTIYLVEKQIKVIMYRILVALNYLHSGGIVHRDIKPANILINSDCSVKICDFSLGRSIAGLTSSYFDCGLAFRKDPILNLSEPSEDQDEENMGDEGEELDEGDKKVPKTVHCSFEVKFDKSATSIKSKALIKEATAKMVIEAKPNNAILEAKKKEQRQVLLSQSKAYNTERELSGHIATRCYRPPEIILLERVYTTAVDMWAAGCVFAELLEMVKENLPDITKRSALFPGRSCFPLSPSQAPTEKILGMPISPHDQLKVILQTFGTVSSSDLSFLNDQRAEDYVKAVLTGGGAYSADVAKPDLKARFPAVPKDAFDLLGKLLAFNPYYRITAKEALRHPYFDEVRDKPQETEMAQQVILLTDTAKEGNMQLLANEVLQKVMYMKA